MITNHKYGLTFWIFNNFCIVSFHNCNTWVCSSQINSDNSNILKKLLFLWNKNIKIISKLNPNEIRNTECNQDFFKYGNYISRIVIRNNLFPKLIINLRGKISLSSCKCSKGVLFLKKCGQHSSNKSIQNQINLK